MSERLTQFLGVSVEQGCWHQAKIVTELMENQDASVDKL